MLYNLSQERSVLMVRTEPRRAASTERAVATKAVLRAATRLGLSNKALGRIIGVSEATVSRMGSGSYTARARRQVVRDGDVVHPALSRTRCGRERRRSGGCGLAARGKQRARRHAARLDRIGLGSGPRPWLPGRPPRSRLNAAGSRAAAGGSSRRSIASRR